MKRVICLLLLAAGGPSPSDGAFRSSSQRALPSVTQLHAFNQPPTPDPYANLLEKVAPGVPGVASSAVQATPPAAIPEVPEAVVKAATSSSSGSDLGSLMGKNMETIRSLKAPNLDEWMQHTMEGAKRATSAPSPLAGVVGKPLLPTVVVPDTETVDRLASARDKLDVIKQNLFNAPAYVTPKLPHGAELPLPSATKSGVDALTNNAKPAVQAMTAASLQLKSAADAVKASAPQGVAGIQGKASAATDALQTLFTNMHVNEYGAWYIAGVSLLLMALQRNSGKVAAKEQYMGELERLEHQANGAAHAAEMAERNAIEAVNMAAKANGINGHSSPSAILEETRMQQFAVEQQMMKAEMAQLKAENAELRAALEKALNAIPAPTFSMTPPLVSDEFDEDDEEMYDEHMTGDDDEMEMADDDERILAAIREIDDLNRAAKAEAEKAMAEVKSAKAEDKAAAEARAVTAAAEAAAMEETMQKEVEAALDAIEPVNGGTAVNGATKKKKKAPAKRKAKGKGRAKVAKKELVVQIPVAAMHAASHPWGSLAPSSLSRKTVAELSAFLDERGVESYDESGKKLLKRDLLTKVKSLL